MAALTFKSQFRSRADRKATYKAPSADHVNVNDALCDAELAGIARAKALAGGVANNGYSERYCNWAELIVGGHRIACLIGHDCDYVRARSALVPDAVDAALRMRGKFMKNYCALMEKRSAPLLNGATDHAGG
jgi:hypothetical protein